jgi:hypothetical protein
MGVFLEQVQALLGFEVIAVEHVLVGNSGWKDGSRIWPFSWGRRGGCQSFTL